MIFKTDKFKTINKLKDKFSIKLLCKLACVSRSGYYTWITSNYKDNDSELKKKILQVYNNSKCTYGYRRIKVALKRNYKLNINHKKIRRLMNALGIKSIIRQKKFKYINPKNIDIDMIEPNIINRDFKANGLNEKWVTDITYLYYGKERKKAYLSALMDLYNNEIISYKLSTSFDMSFVEETLTEAFSKEKGHDLSNLIIHSDQGCHYKSRSYKKILQDHNITQSMSRKGNCYDNACIENFFGHLKCELIHQRFFETKAELFNSIHEYIYWYNNERFQCSLENRTPSEVRSAA